MIRMDGRMKVTNGGWTPFPVAILMSLYVFSMACGDGMYRDGVGAITTGRGGTNLGFADNGEVLLDNPGGLVNVESLGLVEVGLDTLFTDLTYFDPDNPRVHSNNNPFPMGQLSLIRRSEDGTWAAGLGFYSHAGFSATYDMNGPNPLIGPRRYKGIGAMARVLPGVSVRVNDRLSVGATFGLAIGHAELEGPYFIQGPSPFVGTPTLMDVQGTGAGVSWSTGLQYQLSPYTTIGASFQAESSVNLNGTTRLTIPGMGSSAFDSELQTEWPATLGIGIQHKLSPWASLGLDVIWTAWSDALDTYDLRLSSPTNPVFGAVLGNSLTEQFPLQWRDSVAVRIRWQQTLSPGTTFRTGYVYHKNPIPSSPFTPFIQTNVEHSYSIGLGRRLNCYAFDIAYQFMWGPDQSVGSSQFVGGDFDNSGASVQAHWLLMSLTRYF